MVQAIIDIQDNTNRVLNIIKARYGLKDKSKAIDQMAREYADAILEPAIRPSYIKKIKSIEKEGKFSSYKSLSSLTSELEHA